MIIISIKLLIDSIASLVFKNELYYSIYLIIVSIITIVVKICLFVYTNRLNKKFNNILLNANAKDHFNDCIITTFTLLSILLASKGIYWFDGIVGTGIAIWISFSRN